MIKLLTLIAIVAEGTAAQAAMPRDVPAGHWAGAAVLAVTKRGIMDVADGRFDGDHPVTRTDLSITLARMAKSLARGAWIHEPPSPLAKVPTGTKAEAQRPVTRYELAALVDKMARDISVGLAKTTGATYNPSVVIPQAAALSVSKTNRAYGAVAYLSSNHLQWGDSVALHPGPASVTPAEVANAMSQLIAGLMSRRTDEPELRAQVAIPPRRKP